MPTSEIRSASDADEYRAINRRSCVELTITTRGSFTARITRIDLPRLWMQRGSESLPRIRHAEPSPGRNIIAFLTGKDQTTIRNGAEFRADQLALLSPHHSHRYRSFGPIDWAGMSRSRADVTEISSAIAGHDLMPGRDEQIITPPAAAIARLQRLHAAAGYLAEQAPEVIANPQAAHGLEQNLIDALVDCLLGSGHGEDAAARRRHTLIMQRFHQTLEASDGSAVYLPELCTRIGVSGRTLRLCCQEHLGMSPKQYLTMRRMHLVRRALRHASPKHTVTEIAMTFGFWELGRFAVRYKSIFGESPSETMRRTVS
jgi:AraC-like DNA-binding protein